MWGESPACNHKVEIIRLKSLDLSYGIGICEFGICGTSRLIMAGGEAALHNAYNFVTNLTPAIALTLNLFPMENGSLKSFVALLALG